MRLATAASLILWFTAAHGHGPGFLGLQPVDWRTAQIIRVVAHTNGREPARTVTLNGKQCVESNGFSFDVDDQFAFDIDEPVQLEVGLHELAEGAAPEARYEKNGESMATVRGQISALKQGAVTHKVSFTLERARFANRGLFLTDFSIGVDSTVGYTGLRKITICDVSLQRSYATVVPKEFGTVALEVVDETGKNVPARVGIYDQTGRLPLPSKEAPLVSRLGDMIRVVHLTPGLIPWPARNPSVFYVDGSYHARLPVGQYQLVVGKGPEYRFFHHSFAVERGRTQTIKVSLQRWDDLPEKGWYSGDNHVHYLRRDKSGDPNLLLFTQAEDLHVTNVLQVGNYATLINTQPDWNPVVAATDRTYAFVPGQEDPRTTRHGHTTSLHLEAAIRDPRRYLLYHDVFEKVRAQGGVTGYAHAVGEGAFNARGGLALDVPFGLVDFAEVMQFGFGGSNVWFDFLNLGYRLAPSAGSDYMLDYALPGAERVYAHVPKPFSLQGWFDALKRGATFVTNGPLLEFTVNGQGMGSELRLQSGEPLSIDASASLNPDIDDLESLELIEQGEVVKSVKAANSGATTLRLHHEATARHGTWFVVRARGKRAHEPHPEFIEGWGARQGSAKIAFSGAVYVYVDDQGFWKPCAVPAIVQRMKQGMETLMAPESGEDDDAGTREAALKAWDSQQGLLEQRIDQVMPSYERLLAQAKEAAQKQPSRRSEGCGNE